MAVTLGDALVRVRLDTSGVRPQMDTAFRRVDADRHGRALGTRFTRSMTGAFRGIGGRLTAALAAIGAARVFGTFISEAREAARITRITTQVIKSTGGAAKISAQQVADLSQAISNKVGVDDEAIQAGANLLLTFKNIRNEAGAGNQVFSRATQAIVDMAAGMNRGEVTASGLKSSTIQLGKALNDPIKGMGALSRVGIQFTDQQKKQITAMVKSGNLLGAQKIILKEVESQFGGAAQAAADPMQRLQVVLANLAERIGTALLPHLTRLATFLITTLIPAGERFFGFLSRNRAVLIPLAGVVGTLVVALKVWVAVQTVLNIVLTANPIGLIIVAIGALVAGIVLAYRNSQTFRTIVQAAWHGIQVAASFAWNTVLKPIFLALKFYITKIVIPYYRFLWAVAKAVWGGISAAARVAWNIVIKPIFNAVRFYITKILVPVYQFLWRAVRAAFTGVGAAIRFVWNSIIRPTFGALRHGVVLVRNAFSVAVSAIRRIWDGLRSATRKPVEFVVNTVYNKGIRRAWNLIAGLVKLPQLPYAKFARGGILPGYTPGRDVLSLPMADFSGGEAIMRPEFTRAAGPGWVNAANAAARRGGVRGAASFLAMSTLPGGLPNWATRSARGAAFAEGGIIGSLVRGAKSLVVKGASKILDRGASFFAAKILNPILNRLPGADSTWARAILSLPKRMIDGFLGWLKKYVDPKLGGDAAAIVRAAKRELGEGEQPPGSNNTKYGRWFGINPAPWCDMFISYVARRAGAGKAVGSFASVPSHWANIHSRGRIVHDAARPGDLAFFRGLGHIGLVVGPGARTVEGNHSSFVQYVNRTRGEMRLARPAYGMDAGGLLHPGALAINRTRHPERTLSPQQTEAFDRLVNALTTGTATRPTIQLGPVTVQDGADVDLIARRLSFALRMATLG